MAYALAFLIGVAVGALSVYWFVLRHKLEDYRRIEQSREQWKELAERQNQLLDALSIVNAAAKGKVQHEEKD